MYDTKIKSSVLYAIRFLSLILMVTGIALIWGGVILVSEGGSWYYLLSGIVLIGSGFLIWRGKPSGIWLFLLFFLGTVIWSLAEVGFQYWPLVPRLGLPLIFAVLVAFAAPSLVDFRYRDMIRKFSFSVAGLLIALLAVLFGLAFQPHNVIEPSAAEISEKAEGKLAEPQQSEWRSYAQSPTGIRYAPLDQITPENVKKLQVAWTFRTGDTAGFPGPGADQSTPIQVGDFVYVCTPTSQVFALDADSGKQRWHYDPKAALNPVHPRCRGVEYFDADTAKNVVPRDAAAPGVMMDPAIPVRLAATTCRQRIMLTTMDARLQALDAKTGALCDSFGDHGTVNLRYGLDNNTPGWYSPTSAPTVVGNLVIVGGWVSDGMHRDVEPSGVVRAYNAETGALVWAWDAGNPDTHGLPPDGKHYTHDSPNMWSHASFDEKLGLLYLPVGGTIPDYYGVGRSAEVEKRTTSVVAVDIATGHERWVYQVVHHDLWDYDVSPQPALYDIPDGKGGTIPALVQGTKMGEIFVLDRRTGKPITEVKEVPVPQSAVPGEHPSPTQPISVGMPRIGGGRLNESDMWGISMFDQLTCRIKFRSLRYEGSYTPATTEKTLHYPGVLGGMNWAGVSISPTKDYLIVNDIRIGQMVQFFPREKADQFAKDHPPGHTEGLDYMPAVGTPYGINRERFQSPLAVPCQAPPFGTMTAIDLKTKKIAWQRPLGTVEETGPMGIRTGLPVPIGMPTLGASINTKSGLIFYAGTLDFYLRAFDVNTGKEIWKSPLPVGAQATPMSYQSPKSGRQFVVISAGGSSGSPKKGDYVIAYALPEQK